MLHHRTYELGPGHDWVVFVHGAGGSSAIWFRQVREFRRHFNVLLLDLRGHGESQPLPQVVYDRAYTFEEIAAEVLEVLDHRGIGSAHFIGVSLGTLIIRTIGQLAPERVRSMVMGGAVTRLNLRSRVLVTAANGVKRVLPFLWLYRVAAWIIMPRRRHRESRGLFVREARKLARKEFLRWFHLTANLNPLFRLFEESEVPAPTLYLMGDEDYMFLPAVRRLVARHRWSVLRVIEHSGHVCNVDQPEQFNRLAIDFLHGRFGPPALSASA